MVIHCNSQAKQTRFNNYIKQLSTSTRLQSYVRTIVARCVYVKTGHPYLLGKHNLPEAVIENERAGVFTDVDDEADTTSVSLDVWRHPLHILVFRVLPKLRNLKEFR